MSKSTTRDTTIGHLRRCAVAIPLALLAASASAQTPAPALDLRLHQPPDMRAEASPTAVNPDDPASGTDTTVHGSFSTEIGYSKTFGNSTVNTAELDVNKRYDSGRSLNLHIDVLRSTGLPNVAPVDYVSRYPHD